MKRFSNSLFKQSKLSSTLLKSQMTRHYASSDKAPIAVVMSGAGHLDGSEVSEAVSVLVALQRRERDFVVVAPKRNVEVVYDHSTETVEKHEVRDMQSEVMRITRQSKITVPSAVTPEKFSSVIFVGGNGVGRNLSTYSSDGAQLSVDPEIESLIKSFHSAKKPMGFMCISPVLAAKVLGTAAGGPGLRLAVGGDQNAKEDVEKLGNIAVTGGVHALVRDEENAIVSTPAYLASDANFATVFDAADSFVNNFARGFSGGAGGSRQNWGNIESFFKDQLGDDGYSSFRDQIDSAGDDSSSMLAERKAREERNQERTTKMDRLREQITEMKERKNESSE